VYSCKPVQISRVCCEVAPTIIPCLSANSFNCAASNSHRAARFSSFWHTNNSRVNSNSQCYTVLRKLLWKNNLLQLGSPWICPRSLSSQIFRGLLFGWTLWMYRTNLQSVAALLTFVYPTRLGQKPKKTFRHCCIKASRNESITEFTTVSTFGFCLTVNFSRVIPV